MAFNRISADPAVMARVPCIRGTRIPVASVVGMVAEGMTPAEIVSAFPHLTADDVRYAAARVDERDVPLHLGA